MDSAGGRWMYCWMDGAPPPPPLLYAPAALAP
jgi:hypothetical protein